MLVCCTGGEEGDLHNPTLREPGQPFHGLTPEEEKAKVVAMRPAELAESARIIGFDEVVMLGYRDSGMPETPPNEHPDSFHQADIDEATGRLVDVIRRTRPQVILTYNDDQQFYPHPDHLKVHDISLLAFDRAGDPEWYPELGEPVPAVEAVLLDVVSGAAVGGPRSPHRARRHVAVRREVVRAAGQRPPHHHPRRGRRLPVRPLGVAACPRHAGRPDRVVVVRPRRRRDGRRLPVGGLDPRPLAGRRRSPPRPVEDDLFAGIRSRRVSP